MWNLVKICKLVRFLKWWDDILLWERSDQVEWCVIPIDVRRMSVSKYRGWICLARLRFFSHRVTFSFARVGFSVTLLRWPGVHFRFYRADDRSYFSPISSWKVFRANEISFSIIGVFAILRIGGGAMIVQIVMDSFVHSFICSWVRSFIRSLVYSFLHVSVL